MGGRKREVENANMEAMWYDSLDGMTKCKSSASAGESIEEGNRQASTHKQKCFKSNFSKECKKMALISKETSSKELLSYFRMYSVLLYTKTEPRQVLRIRNRTLC